MTFLSLALALALALIIIFGFHFYHTAYSSLLAAVFSVVTDADRTSGVHPCCSIIRLPDELSDRNS